MNTAIFASQFHPHFGGVEELCRQLAHEQKRQGDHPLIVTNRWPKTLSASEEFEGLPIRRHVFRVPDFSWKQRCAAQLLEPSIVRQVCADVEKHRADVLHVQCVSTNGYYARKVRARLRLPLVVTLQGELTMDASRLYERSDFARQNLRDILTEADIITGCSGKTVADAEAFYGKPFGDKAQVIFNGANVEEFQKAEPFRHRRPYFFALGRLVPQKGFDVLLRAFARIESSTHDLIIAGDGTERESLEKLAVALKIQDRVVFYGRADHEQVKALFSGSDFFVIPSRADEGLPVVIAEAMAAGKAIVGTHVGGVPEAVIHRKTGLVVPREDEAALVAALKELIDNRDLREQMGKAGQTRSHLLSWSIISEQYVKAYQLASENFRKSPCSTYTSHN